MQVMTDINPAAKAAQDAARQDNGTFGTQEHSAPEAELDFRPELDAANQAYWENGDLIIENVEDYLRYGMPEGAHRVEFERSDQGDYVYAARAFAADGSPIDTENDYDRWANVDDVVSMLGDPDDNRSTFADLFTSEDGRVFTWVRAHETNEADEQAIRERLDRLSEVRQDLAGQSQHGAILAVRRLIPDGSTVTFGWSDQGDFLCVEKVTLADGTDVENDWDSDSDIDFDDLDQAASDIRNISDLNLTEVPGSNGNKFTLTQKAGA